MPAKSAKKKVAVSTSAQKVAVALVKNFPTDAAKIVALMSAAATSRSMIRKLGRVKLALEAMKAVKP